jgi:hypothetical protein
VPLSVFIGAGQTAAFYITKGSGQNEVRSSAGTAVGATAVSNADITVKQGIEVANTFEPQAGAVIQNVRVTYSTCAP